MGALIFALAMIIFFIIFTTRVVKYGAGVIAKYAYDRVKNEYKNYPEVLKRFEGDNVLAFGYKKEFTRRKEYATGLIELKEEHLIIHSFVTESQLAKYSDIDLNRTKYDLKRNWIYLYLKNDHIKYFVRTKPESDESVITGFALFLGILKENPASLEANNISGLDSFYKAVSANVSVPDNKHDLICEVYKIIVDELLEETHELNKSNMGENGKSIESNNDRTSFMTFIESVKLEKYNNKIAYELIETGIYHNLITDKYVITLKTEIENKYNTQYPLNDLLEKYYVNCTEHTVIEEVGNKVFYTFEIESEEREPIYEFKSFIGKTAYNYLEGGFELLGFEH